MKLEILKELNAERAARRPVIIVTDTANGDQRLVKAADIAGDPLRAELSKQLRIGKSGNVEVAGKKLFLNVYAPTAKLVIIGAVHISQALAPLARTLGYDVTVVDPRWVLPVPAPISTLAAAHKLVVTLEDNGEHGGIGSAVSAALRRQEIDVPCRDAALPQEFFAHASRGEVLNAVGLTERNIARQITGWVAALGASVGEREVSQHVD